MKKNKKKIKKIVKKALKFLSGISIIILVISFLLDFLGKWDLGKPIPSVFSDNISVSYLGGKYNGEE